MSDVNLTVLLQGELNTLSTGNDAAAERLIALAYPRLLFVARHVLGDAARLQTLEETASLLSATYERLLRSVVAVRPPTVAQFFALAGMKLRQRLSDLLRKVRGRLTESGSGARPKFIQVDQAEDDGSATCYRFEAADLDAAEIGDRIDLMAAVDRLPEEERQVFEMIRLYEFTQKEAAGMIGVDERTIRRRLVRAEATLSDHLAGYNDSGSAT